MFFGHYLNERYRSNPFSKSGLAFFSTNTNERHIYYYDKILKSYTRVLSGVTVWGAVFTSESYGTGTLILNDEASFNGYPVFGGSLDGNAVYMYINNNNYGGQQRIIIYKQCGYPCFEKKKFNWNATEQEVEVNSVWEDCFISYPSVFPESGEVQFQGKGKYEGETLVVNYQLQTSNVWVNNSSSPYGEYVPYTGIYSKGTPPVDTHYLGCRQWLSDKYIYVVKDGEIKAVNSFILSPRKKTKEQGEQWYDISNVHWVYDSATGSGKWVIWGDETQTFWYENTQEYPIKAQDYVYKYQSIDGSVGEDLILSFNGYVSSNGIYTTDVLYFEEARMF